MAKTLEEILAQEKARRQEDGIFGIKACKESIKFEVNYRTSYAYAVIPDSTALEEVCNVVINRTIVYSTPRRSDKVCLKLTVSVIRTSTIFCLNLRSSSNVCICEFRRQVNLYSALT